MIALMEKIEKEEIVQAVKTEIKQIVGVIEEHFDDKIKLVVEQYDEIKDTQALHTETLKDLTVDMTAVKSDVKVIDAKLDRKADVKDLVMLDRRVTVLENNGN